MIKLNFSSAVDAQIICALKLHSFSLRLYLMFIYQNTTSFLFVHIMHEIHWSIPFKWYSYQIKPYSLYAGFTMPFCCCIGLKGLKELLSNQGAILPDFSAFILIILIHIYCTFVPRHFLDPFKMQLYSCPEPNWWRKNGVWISLVGNFN